MWGLIGGVAIALIATSVGRAEVHFKTVSFDDAKKLAAKEHKLIMVDFYTSWCGWCKVLDRKTYTDENVGKIADAKFISIKLDAEHGEGVGLAHTYGITGYPTIIFFSADGKEVDRVVGYEDADRFARSLETAAAGGAKAAVDATQGANPTKDPEKWLIAGNYLAEHGDNAGALSAFKQVLELDPSNKHGQKEEAIYDVGFLTSDGSQWKTLETALQEFPKRAEAQQATMILVRHDFEQKQPESAARRMDRWAMAHPDDGQMFNFFAWTAAENSAVLDKAAEYAKRALAIAPTPQEKASVMDTQAEVLFKSGKTAEASKTESDALAMLDPGRDKKLYNELAGQKAKFDKAAGETANSASNPK